MIDKFFTDLVGTRVNVVSNTKQTKYGPMTSCSIDDPEFMAKIDARPEKIRLKFSGYMYTQDIRMDRINIRIDNNGLITEVYKG